MATPVGHVLAGRIVYRALGWPDRESHERAGLGWLCAFAAVAADLDFLPGLLLGRPALYHQGASHSFVAAALVSGILAALWSRGRRPLWIPWLTLFLAYSSHLVLDLFGPDRRPPFGIPLWWPFRDDTYLSPVSVFPGVRHAGRTGVETGEWLARTLHPRNALAVVWEVALLGPLALFVEWVSSRRHRMSGKRK